MLILPFNNYKSLAWRGVVHCPLIFSISRGPFFQRQAMEMKQLNKRGPQKVLNACLGPLGVIPLALNLKGL